MASNNAVRLGVFVDAENASLSGGFGLRYDVLKKLVTFDGEVPLRLNTYVANDPDKMKADPEYYAKTESFRRRLREIGFKVVLKDARHIFQKDGTVHTKANADITLTVDALEIADGLDSIVLVTGDGDFTSLVEALQRKSTRVTVIGFDNVSHMLIDSADVYIPGLIVPGLVPLKQAKDTISWGDVGSRVRGVCAHYNDDKRFGYVRYMNEIGDITETDIRGDGSPFNSIFFHISKMSLDKQPKGPLSAFLCNPKRVFEFTIAQNERNNKTNEKSKLFADDIVIYT